MTDRIMRVSSCRNCNFRESIANVHGVMNHFCAHPSETVFNINSEVEFEDIHPDCPLDLAEDTKPEDDMEEICIEHKYESIYLCIDRDDVHIEMYDNTRDWLITGKYTTEEATKIRDFLNEVLESENEYCI